MTNDINFIFLDPVSKMKEKSIKIVLVISLLVNLLILVFFGKTMYSESKKIGKHISADHKTVGKTSDYKFFNGNEFNLQGKFSKEQEFSRLPLEYKNTVRPQVWKLSRNSSGISIRFRTNSSDIAVKWKLSNFREYHNMTRICASGLDLYCLVNGMWQYVNSGIPKDHENEQILISGMDTISKDFRLYLPLYDGIKNIEIGIQREAEILGSTDDFIAKKPIVFYGTSITQGGSASRPGLAYPSIISRNLNIETINLGFSGNGLFEKTVGEVLCDIDAAMYVIDCVPNSSPEVIKRNALAFIKQIRDCKPNVPILFVESIIREHSYFQKMDKNVFEGLFYIQSQNDELRSVYDKAIAVGIDNLYYLPSSGLIGYDHEGTVDGTHLNDLGMMRIAGKIEEKIRMILKNYGEREK